MSGPTVEVAPGVKASFPPDAGIGFVGYDNVRADIYPAIDVSKTSALQQPGKVVLITGAGRGIGRSMAIQYALANVSTIIISSRTASELDEVQARVQEANPRVQVWKEVFSVLDHGAVKDLVRRVSEKLGKLDILINNAGMSLEMSPSHEIDPEDYWKVMELNVRGPMLLTHAFLPLLIKTAEANSVHVNLINITSIGAVMVLPGGSPYHISKLALQRQCEFLSLEYGAKGLNIVGIHPGAVETRLSNDITALKHLMTDGPDLSGGFVVWLSAADRRWLNGRYVSATWDVDALENKQTEIVKGDKLKIKLVV
ncbi:putative oxidoreductase ucpA [Paraphoma chrysanthemicola]|uniref:Oxidoreductase ucpA n=1 Tax=Paraphoma chrysanthemicola TaxID=798071 RepID=A0A8K0QXP2_9PLEO|nr:putative oxidoreductase ucpA [Paraphoma chrysanthemicola]